MTKQRIKLRYDGKYDFMAPPNDRQWTIMSRFIDKEGQDRFQGSFGLAGLIELGIVPPIKLRLVK